MQAWLIISNVTHKSFHVLTLLESDCHNLQDTRYLLSGCQCKDQHKRSKPLQSPPSIVYVCSIFGSNTWVVVGEEVLGTLVASRHKAMEWVPLILWGEGVVK